MMMAVQQNLRQIARKRDEYVDLAKNHLFVYCHKEPWSSLFRRYKYR